MNEETTLMNRNIRIALLSLAVAGSAGALGACATSPSSEPLTDAQRLENQEFRGDSRYARQWNDKARSSGGSSRSIGERMVRSSDQSATARSGKP